MTTVRIRFLTFSVRYRLTRWFKERAIGFALWMEGLVFNPIFWASQHGHEWIVDVLGPLHWWIQDHVVYPICDRCYEGSQTEIEQGVEFAEDYPLGSKNDWLSPFQRMIANERILPL